MHESRRAADKHPFLPSDVVVRADEVTLPSALETPVSLAPDTIALVCGGHSLSYGEFNSRVNRLARFLIARGIGPECVVALALHRSIDLIVSLAAVLKAGAAYLPLDPTYPVERWTWLLADIAPDLVTTTDLASRLPTGRVRERRSS